MKNRNLGLFSFKLNISIIFTILLFSSSCRTYYEQIYSLDQEEAAVPQNTLDRVRSLPPSTDIPFEDRIIRMYVHFFNNLDGSLNYNRDQAASVVYKLLDSANDRMKKNDEMNLPEGNDTPSRDSHIKYKLALYKGHSGIFFHYEKEPQYFIKRGKKSNRYDRKMISDYAVRPDSVLNVFIMPFDPKQLASGEQKAEQTAIALGTTIKLPGLYQSSAAVHEYAGIFNHEVGHILNLRHSWDSNDGCDDTPHHDNCWNKMKDPPCDGATSNNLMDYNAHQSAITPCQITRMHAALATPGRKANRLVEGDKCLPLDKSYTISFDQKWTQTVRLRGDLIIATDATLYLKSLLQMANESKIIIEKGGTLLLENASLYNTCGNDWGGILKHPQGHLYLIGKNNRLKNLPIDSGTIESST